MPLPRPETTPPVTNTYFVAIPLSYSFVLSVRRTAYTLSYYHLAPRLSTGRAERKRGGGENPPSAAPAPPVFQAALE